MYVGVDFLIDTRLNLYLSEVNTGVPGGAQEYDLIHRMKYSQPSGIFDRINSLSQKRFGKDFYDYTNGLSYIDDLRALKIWMDGKGPLPENPAPALRLEDKWVQYLLLSEEYPLIPTRIFDRNSKKDLQLLSEQGSSIVLKKRLGRGGEGFLLIQDITDLRALDLAERFYLIQPYVESQIGLLKLSLRATAFVGEFLCMFANLSPRSTSNHGYRFYVSPGDRLKLSDEKFKTRRVIQRAWEADVFFKGNIPDYLYENISVEDIAEAELIIPPSICGTIKKIASSISRLYMDLDYKTLPKSYIEERMRPAPKHRS